MPSSSDAIKILPWLGASKTSFDLAFCFFWLCRVTPAGRGGEIDAATTSVGSEGNNRIDCGTTAGFGAAVVGTPIEKSCAALPRYVLVSSRFLSE